MQTIRPLLAALPLLLALAWPRPAAALDAWRDRRGPLFGLGGGGGGGWSDTDDDGLRGGRDGVGLSGQVRAGGGLAERLTLDASATWYGQGTKSGAVESTNSHLLLAAAANAFLTEHLFLRGGVGIGRGSLSDQVGSEVREVSAFSLAYLLGGGIEFFLTSDLAASFTLQWQQHLYSTVRYAGVNGLAGLTWY